MNRINHQKELEKIISGHEAEGKIPTLMLHSCCAPCSSYCLTYLMPHFDITCFYYNPNITDEDEYLKRVNELKRLVGILNEEAAAAGSGRIPVKVIDGGSDPDLFFAAVKDSGTENEPEGGRRCTVCFSMRLKETYKKACEAGADYFTTTLTISPLKDAQRINDIGYSIASESPGGTLWLPSDFKKNDGYKTSIELSKRYGLYRQDYCGCPMSKRKDHI